MLVFRKKPEEYMFKVENSAVNGHSSRARLLRDFVSDHTSQPTALASTCSNGLKQDGISFPRGKPGRDRASD